MGRRLNLHRHGADTTTMDISRPRGTCCPICWTRFADIWAYKRHQDACIDAHTVRR